MKIAMSACVLAAALSSPVRGEVLGVSSGPEMPVEARVAVEVILGGAGALSGYSAGFIISKKMSGPEAFAGIAVGSWMGTSIGGILLGGNGSWIGSLLGTVGGSALSFALSKVIVPGTEESGWRTAMMVLLPVCGAAIGYEVGQALGAGPPLKRMAPAFSIAPDGRGALAGVAGTF